MRIGVRPIDRVRPLPVLRVDRNGLTVAGRDDIELAPIGLPRRALIVCDSASLCELRLVPRAMTRTRGRTSEITMQPSRADDHAVLWQALRAHQQQLGTVPASSPAPWSTVRDGLGRCGAVFGLANADDAWFFSQWLEYHFAEVRARTRMFGAAADLHAFERRIVDHEVEVRFLFEAGERIVGACTEASCRWIAAEAARQVGMTVEHWLSGPSIASGTPGVWPTRATLVSGATRHPS